MGVIGVIECNFLDPTHNKQNFMETDKYRRTMLNLATKLKDYWKEIRYRRSRDDPNNTTPVEDTIKQPDQNWMQCDKCLNWRKLPDGIDCSKLPDKWFCYLNPDPQFRSCKVSEEPMDSDDDQPSYHKTYKQQERENKKQQVRKRQKVGEARRYQEDHYLAMSRQNDALRRQKQRLIRQLHQTLDIVEEERASLVSQCEELRLSLQQQMGNAPRGGTAPHQTTDASVSTDPEDAGGTVESGSDTSRSLVELRQNIGRLLVPFVPALDLAQVNFECNVIDEILEQFLCQQESE